MSAQPADDVVAAVHWCPTGTPLSGVPSAVVRLLATAEGKGFGYGHGEGWSTVFGSEHGDVTVHPGQWVLRHADGHISVQDSRPNMTHGKVQA